MEENYFLSSAFKQMIKKRTALLQVASCMPIPNMQVGGASLPILHKNFVLAYMEVAGLPPFRGSILGTEALIVGNSQYRMNDSVLACQNKI